mmetsp:Transcript_44806/g.50240  ORF Transcript_44806/g.50240 Transcript_44806/m.50240 type:complete len:129 (-) Transcript_44806:531-917(-)
MTPGNKGHCGAAVLPEASSNRVIQPPTRLAVNNYPAVTNIATESQGTDILRNKLRQKTITSMSQHNSNIQSVQYQQALVVFNMTTKSEACQTPTTSELVQESLEDSFAMQKSTVNSNRSITSGYQKLS